MTEQADLIERLRLFSLARSGELRPNADARMADDARAEIARLRSELAQVREILGDRENTITCLRESRLRDERAMERLDKELTERTEETMRSRAQRDQLLAALSWIEDQDPQVVDAAREKFNLAAAEEKP